VTDLGANAADLAATALRTVREAYPYDLRVLYEAPGAAPRTPRDRHPAFYGSFDWHSAVEMHWVLLRLLRRFPAEVDAGAIHAVLDEHLTPAAIETEVVNYAANRGAQRPYGWGWALTLHEEAAAWPVASAWAAALQPLADHFLDALLGWLPRAPYPVRHGVHPNSAFGLVRSLASARRRAPEGDERVLRPIEAGPRRGLHNHDDAPGRWGP
jgi:hypothetical protein